MAVVDVDRHHQDLVDELIAVVEEYNPGVDKELLARAFRFAATAHEGQTRQLRRAVRPPSLGGRQDLRRAPSRRAVARRRAPARRGRGHGNRARRRPRRVRRRDRPARRGRHEADPDELPDPRAVRRRELPQDDRRDGAGRPRHPDQARRPAPQHAHDRVPGQAGPGAQGEGDARGLRAARAPARHQRDEVGARGPLLRDPAPAQVRRDQGDGRRPARRPGGRSREGERRAAAPSSRRWTSPPRSRAARSTSIRSTTRWPRRAASSTRSTT